MHHSNICLKLIRELLADTDGSPTQFWIPAYQRGYRWASLQVTQLLEDIFEFSQRRNPQPDDYYCLQPLVIKTTEHGPLEVVDGQQRLTTLLLIMRYFNERLAKKYQQKLFILSYETRPKLLEFLESPDEAAANSNVDYFYLYNATKTIEDWFDEHDHEVEVIKSALLNNTKVIWFELADQDNPVDAFTRLNVGKIALTDDELIRALFLKRADAGAPETITQQLKIAYEWDQLEKALQINDFWHFLSNQPSPSQNRIGLLFELVAKMNDLDTGSKDRYGIFHAYNEKLKTAGDAKNEWLLIKQNFMMLEEWYEDRILYHIIGFLIYCDVDIAYICRLSQHATKSTFEHKLRKEVFFHAFGNEDLDALTSDELRSYISEYLKDLEYGRDSAKIRLLLLLFNLATLLDNPRSNLRFQFDNFKSDEWDIEHVRSIASNRPERPHEKISWLELCYGYLKNLEPEGQGYQLLNSIQVFTEPKTESDNSDEAFNMLYDNLLGFFGEQDEISTDHRIGEKDEIPSVHGIGNLTLLNRSTNRSYKNAVFAVKRKKLLELDQSGVFVPLCTRNVFLKCYSPQVDNVMFWSQADRNAYQAEIIKVLVSFFSASKTRSPL